MRDFLKFILIMLVLVIVFFGLIKPAVVKESSMATTLNDGDYLILSRVAYIGDATPERGDIVTFKTDPNSEAAGILLVKRVIGVAGDKVEIADGKVFINGDLLDEPYVTGLTESDTAVFEVPDNMFFAMGDNRQVSFDSRKLGCISEDDIVGKVVVRLYPFSQISKF